MIKTFLQKIFSGRDGGLATGKPATTVQYNGYSISPRPRQKAGGWTIEATIEQDNNAEVKHVFVRADICNSKQLAVDLTIHKAKTWIDQQR